METRIQCSAPECRACRAPKEMWLPERSARQRANDGKPVALADLPKFALCGRHGHMLREEGVRVYRYEEELARLRKAEEQRAADALSFQPFAARFAGPQGKVKSPQKGGRRSFDGVGQGLSRCAKEDAAKRSSEPEAPPPAKPNGLQATVPS